MLKFNRLVILFMILLTGSLVLKMSLFVSLAITILFVLIVGYGCFNLSFGMFVKALCTTDRKEILITFDDGPDSKTTPQILEILKKHNVKALFFMTGKKSAENPELLRKIVSEGHSIGNHTFSHSNLFPIYSVKKMSEEIERTSAIIEKTTGKKTLLFRPPFGVTNPNIATTLRKNGLKVVGWSLRSLDTVTKDPEVLSRRILNKIREGDIVLFHDTCEQTVQILDNFIEVCIERGFEFVDADYLSGVDND
jgi:peptidoglycan/xylan/chitin deacetylase (PgdA/CDA1 family)